MAAEPTAFLYPFIEGDERDAAGLLDTLARSAREKILASVGLTADTLAALEPALDAAATAMAGRFVRGGRLFAFGNGGSATDAEAVAAAFAHPLSERSLPAVSLAADPAIVTALANDVGVDVVCARQLGAMASGADMALAISTSGGSANILAGLAAARRMGLLAVGIAGYDGGAMAASDDVDHCLVVRSDSVHRIQEAQDAVLRSLCERVRSRVEVVTA